MKETPARDTCACVQSCGTWRYMGGSTRNMRYDPLTSAGRRVYGNPLGPFDHTPRVDRTFLSGDLPSRGGGFRSIREKVL